MQLMRTAYLPLLFISIFSTIAQAQDAGDNVVYIIDHVPIREEPEEGLATLTPEEVDRVEVLKNKESLSEAGYPNVDGIIYLFTKEYSKRSDSIKAIPTTKLMRRSIDTWYLEGETRPYSGPFIDYYVNGKKQGDGVLHNGKLKGLRKMYYPNGKVSDEIIYENGLPNGLEKRYYEDGQLMQKGELENGKEIGHWEKYHPNGRLMLSTEFVYGQPHGVAIEYYSTGLVKSKSVFEHGIPQKDKVRSKLLDQYSEAQRLYQGFNVKAAIKKMDKVLEQDSTWVEAYFSRGTMKLNDFKFDESIEDFDRAIEIEPYFTNAYSNRAFARLRKYQLGNGKTISNSNGVQIITSKESEVPDSVVRQVCLDLRKGILLGDENAMVVQTFEEYCKQD